MNINLAKIDFCPGQGGGGGSITPEEQAALDTLVNASDGVLYTNVFGQYSGSEKIMSAPEISNSYRIFDVGGGEIYYGYNSDLYKYNSAINDFEKVATFEGLSFNGGIWKDNSGRLYLGKNYQLDIENQTYTYIQSSTGYGIDATYNDYNRVNIFIGNKGIYNLNNSSWSYGGSKSYKFKEDTQTFNTGQQVAGDVNQAVRLIPWFKYKDHYLFSNVNIYEISEGDDEVLTTSNVTGTYFNMIDTSSWNWGINDFNYFVKDGVLYYLNADPNGNEDTVIYVYNETSQEWDTHTINNTKLEEGRFVISGDFLISPSLDHSKMYIVNLGSSTSVNTSWMPINSVAVDLQSDQQIYGSKSFENIDVDNLSVGDVNFKNYDKSFDLGNTTLTGADLKVNIGNVTINDKVPATRDMCYVNRTFDSPGVNFEDICVIPRYNWYNVDQNWKMWYKVPSGDLFYISDYRNYAYKYDPINKEFVTVNTVNNKIVSSHRAVLNQGTELWISKNGSVYRWNNSTEDFDFIISTPDGDDWIWQGDDTTLRYRDMYFLNYDSGTDTYSWDPVQTAPTFNECYSYILNGQIYLYVPYMNAIYTWDEVNHQESLVDYLGAYPQDGDYLALVNGYFYYYASGVEIRRIDVNETGENFDTWTNIPSGKGSGQNYPPIFEYDGKYCTERNNNNNEQFCYTYDYSYWSPQPDTSVDGTYTLKASVVNGQVTYEWVLDQI